MNTATVVLNAATVTAAAENSAGAASADLNALTVNDIVLEATVTNSSTAPGAGRYLDIFYAFGTAATSVDIPNVLGASAERLRVLLSPTASEVRVVTSAPTVKRARYIHAWFSHETLLGAATLTLKVVS